MAPTPVGGVVPVSELRFRDGRVTVWHAAAEDVLPTLPDSSVDAVVTDPPYAYEGGFMGQQWDRHDSPAAFQQWCEGWARQCLRVLRPGGYLLAFGGSNTWHRLVCGLEDAGLRIRDSLVWIYSSGFPKSVDVARAVDKHLGEQPRVVAEGRPTRRMVPGSQQHRTGSWLKDDRPPFAPTVTEPATEQARRWQGWGTALKPAHEPVAMAQKPVKRTYAANVLAHGTGGLNVDGCRVDAAGRPLRVGHGQDTAGKSVYGSGGPGGGSQAAGVTDVGRWPTNVVLSHLPLLDENGDVVGDACADGCVDGCPVLELDRQSGVLSSGANPSRRNSDVFRDVYGAFAGERAITPARGADSGGASRFYPVFRYEGKADRRERPRVGRLTHPTVKPLALMRWLVRLVTPPDGLVLDPFLGSGTTAEACTIERLRCVGCERHEPYLQLIEQRLSKPWQQVLDLGTGDEHRSEPVTPHLFTAPTGQEGGSPC